jgi:hypothetical protein
LCSNVIVIVHHSTSLEVLRKPQELSMCVADLCAKVRNLDNRQMGSDKSRTDLVKLQWGGRPVKAACNNLRLNLVFLISYNLLKSSIPGRTYKQSYELNYTLDDKWGLLALHLTSALMNIKLEHGNGCMGQLKRIAGDYRIILCLNVSQISLSVSTLGTITTLVVICTPQFFVPKERDLTYLKDRKLGGCW